MKRFLVILLLMGLVSGCGQKETEEEIIYRNWVTDLKKQTKFDNTSFPFQIRVGVEELTEEEYIYEVVVDSAAALMRDVQMLAMSSSRNEETNPSIGIFDEPVVIKSSKEMKSDMIGVYLVGYIPKEKEETSFSGSIRVLLSYIDITGKKHKIYYQYQK